ncbi:MAG: acetolactate synthase small subunit [Bacteroidales bacterium]|nr:acetolactate synthase small subunit [Bacteroidales bacterium]MBR6277554.1 acetolactate synthase small subunit [Bacteroidales bacterium]
MKHKYTLLIYTENHIGLLNRISIIFTRHKVNIESLNTSPSMGENIHSFVITIITSRDKAEHLRKLIEKQVEVLKAFIYEENQVIAMGVALFKISTSSICANNILEQLIRSSSARIIAVEPEFIVVEKTGTQDDIKNFLDSLSGFDVREFIQSGRVVVTRPMGKLTDYLRQMSEMEEKD